MESLYALTRGLDADGLIWLSGVDLYGGVPVIEQVRAVHVPKLLVAGEFDGDAVVLRPEVEDAAAPPTGWSSSTRANTAPISSSSEIPPRPTRCGGRSWISSKASDLRTGSHGRPAHVLLIARPASSRSTEEVQEETKEAQMDRKTRWIAGSALAIAVVGGGAGVAIATGAGDDERPLTGATLERARAAALEFTGGGTVIESEAGDDGAAYGVEVRLQDGRVVEISLDAEFQVLGEEAEDGPNDRDGRDDR
jgi:uncharacterized membrane protein YkoI